MSKTGVALLILMTFLLSQQVFGFDHAHGKWAQVLVGYRTVDGLIKYKNLKSDTALNKTHNFNTYLAEIQNVSRKEYESWSESNKKSFLINAYNALTIKLVVDHYPVTSIKKIGGLFTKAWRVEFFSLLNGAIKSLDPIEHDWLRPKFKDFRIHAAVNCASISCPVLRGDAFVGDSLDAQLDEQMKMWLKDKTRNVIKLGDPTYSVSKIFDWYKTDFNEWGGGVPAVIARYYSKEMTEANSDVKLKYLEYNWDLNDAQL